MAAGEENYRTSRKCLICLFIANMRLKDWHVMPQWLLQIHALNFDSWPPYPASSLAADAANTNFLRPSLKWIAFGEKMAPFHFYN